MSHWYRTQKRAYLLDFQMPDSFDQMPIGQAKNLRNIDVEDIVRRREGSRAIGFGAGGPTAHGGGEGGLNVEPEDLIKYGLIPEFVGRLPIVTSLAELTENACRWPLGDPKADDFCFCGADAVPGSSYCAHHHRKARR